MSVHCLRLECTAKVTSSTMKGVCEEFFEKAGMKKRVEYDPADKKPYLHPGRQADMLYEGKKVGYLGEVHPLTADAYGIGERAYIAVIDMLKCSGICRI